MYLALNCIVFDVNYRIETVENIACYLNTDEVLTNIIDANIELVDGDAANCDSVKEYANWRYAWETVVS